MDEEREPSIQVLHESTRLNRGINRRVFRTFVSVALLFLVLLHIYAYFFDHPFSESINGDFSDLKFAVMQLSRGLTEVGIYFRVNPMLISGMVWQWLSSVESAL